MAVLIIYSNHNSKITQKVLTPENTHGKGNLNISKSVSKKTKRSNNRIFKKFLK